MEKTTYYAKNYFLSLIFLFFSCFGFAQIIQRGISTTATTTSTTLTIAKPSGIVAGDIMIVNIAQSGNNTTAPSLSGWILIHGVTLGSTARYGAVLYRFAGASDGSNYTFTLGTGVTSAVGSIVAFSGVNNTSPFDVTPGTISVQGSNTSVAATSITTATANAAIIMFGQAANSAPRWSGWATTSPGTLTELFDNQSANASVGAAWAIKATAGSTGAGSATLSAAERNGGFLIALRRGAPEINILGNATSIVDGDTTPSTTDWTIFGSMETSTGIITKTFTVQNTGNATLSIGAITISGTNAVDFTLTTSPSASIPAGGSSTFSVSFDPTTVGIKTAAISIINNDSNENPYDFYIQGTGIQTFFDSDGDGIYDNLDIDDDNDGILDVTEETNCNSANGHKVDYKFLNETFGTGAKTSSFTAAYNATTTYCYEDGIAGANTAECPLQSTWILDDGEYTVVSKITGTTASDPENIHGDLAWYNGEDHTSGDTNGRMAVFNASFTPGIFYETTITGVLSNLPITYSFWVLNIMASSTFPGSILPNVTVEFYDLSNNLLTSLNTGDIGRCSGSTTDNSCSQGVWKQFTTSINLGNVNAFTIRFKNNAPGGAGNDLALDDILISQTLCDLDNDGVADMFDLDADNDGIEDVIEAGLGTLSNARGKIDVAWVDSNTNGLHDGAESAAALPALDSDGDGIPNYIDLDSDNDSLFDVDESGAGNTNAATGFVNGDGDITGDGRGDGPESETFRSKDINGDGITEGYGDGILDIYDYGTGVTFSTQYGNLNQGIANANPATTYLKDTDGDGIPDYLDITSNGLTFDIANTLLIYDYKTLDTNNNGIIDGTADVDKDGILDAFDTAFSPAYFGSPRDMRTKLFLDFDGRNDYGQSTSILGGLSNASLMAWIDLNPGFSTDGVIIGQDKFQIRITSAKKLEAVVNGTTLTYNTTLNVSQWYNVAAVYGGGFLKLYLNGVLVGIQAKTGAIAADASLLTLGKNPIANTKYFKGKIDEVRVFNLALTDSQLQRMVYQEIQDFSSEIRGLIVPKNIATTPASLPFANLLRYYRMDTYKDDIIDDLTTPAADVTGTKIFNHKNIYVQQAPMPFITERTGNFATAVNSPTNDVRGLDLIENDYSIVKVKHNIIEPSNSVDLGMFVDPGVEIIINNDNKLQNDWYLKLDGKIDLVGMSQLVQTLDCDLDINSAGSIERDQQGQNNNKNYNYWSSPVSPINTTANNTDYTVKGIMKDGFNSIPREINWITGYDGVAGTAGTAVSIARFWLYKFDNKVDGYANWEQFLETAALAVGKGYTLKGNAGIGNNFTFVGKPNNGNISNPISANNLFLVGNPYPSAIDAYKFIDDNVSSVERSVTDGTLYFWQHAPENNSHVLANYLGGYALLNKTGGLGTVTPAGISGSGTAAKIPKQYIPVGQGFFVYGTPAGGNVVFNNSQRIFVKENNGTSNTLFRTKVESINSKAKNQDDQSVVVETYKKIRLGYKTNNGYHRQVLLGFMEENATNGIDYGYDGEVLDDFPNDMFLLNSDKQLLIQGEGYFDANASYPIGVKTDVAGKVSFTIDALENFDAQQKVYIYDDETKTYNDIQKNAFNVTLAVGTNDTRFSLRFNDISSSPGITLSVEDNNASTNDIKIAHIQNSNTLKITNNSLDISVEKVTLYNINGQSISTWKIEKQNQQNIQIPIKNLSSGIYVAKVKTTTGELSKKIIIN